MRRLVVTIALLVPVAVPVGAAERIAGPTRYETAAGIASAAFTDASHAVVVRGDAFADALAASSLGVPILLTETDALPEATSDALRDLGVERVTVLGGNGAVAPAVVSAIEALDIDVTRLAGADRYETAGLVSDALARIDPVDAAPSVAVLASGETFADALAIGPYAFTGPHPLLLSRRDSLPSATTQRLATFDEVVIVGGTAAVSAVVEQQVRDLVPTVRRIAGDDRQATAIAIAALFDAPTRIVLARGDRFPDALAAAPLGVPVLLEGDDTTAWLNEHPVAVTVLGDAPVFTWTPQLGDTWHLQLQGDAVTDVDVDVYDLDLFDTPIETIDALHAEGRRVVCYVSVGSWEEWRDDADEWPESVLGEPLDDWPGERWVDVRQLDVLGPLLEARFDVAGAKGCDAVDPDNVDGFQNDTGFPLTEADSLTFNRFLIAAAHERGLAIGLKNALDLVPDLADEVDFAVNEQCLAFEECDLLYPYETRGVPVFGVEYEGTLDEVCAGTADVGAWLLADLALDGRARTCD